VLTGTKCLIKFIFNHLLNLKYGSNLFIEPKCFIVVFNTAVKICETY
jgi:hypothetical protein